MAISCQTRFSCQLFYSEHSAFKAHHKKTNEDGRTQSATKM